MACRATEEADDTNGGASGNKLSKRKTHLARDTWVKTKGGFNAQIHSVYCWFFCSRISRIGRPWPFRSETILRQKSKAPAAQMLVPFMATPEAAAIAAAPFVVVQAESAEHVWLPAIKTVSARAKRLR